MNALVSQLIIFVKLSVQKFFCETVNVLKNRIIHLQEETSKTKLMLILILTHLYQRTALIPSIETNF